MQDAVCVNGKILSIASLQLILMIAANPLGIKAGPGGKASGLALI
jgi:hypothetical protein